MPSSEVGELYPLGQSRLCASVAPPTSCDQRKANEVDIKFPSAHIGNRPHFIIVDQFLARWRVRREEAYETAASFLQLLVSDIRDLVQSILERANAPGRSCRAVSARAGQNLIHVSAPHWMAIYVPQNERA